MYPEKEALLAFVYWMCSTNLSRYTTVHKYIAAFSCSVLLVICFFDSAFSYSISNTSDIATVVYLQQGPSPCCAIPLRLKKIKIHLIKHVLKQLAGFTANSLSLDMSLHSCRIVGFFQLLKFRKSFIFSFFMILFS